MSMDIFLDMGMAIEFYGGTDFLGWNFFFLTWKNLLENFLLNGIFLLAWDFFFFLAWDFVLLLAWNFWSWKIFGRSNFWIS